MLGLSACSSAQSENTQPNGSRNISPQDVPQLLANGASLIDVRNAEEWNDGHLSMARHLPIADFEQQARALNLARDTSIVLHCKSGGRASRAAEILQDLGYSDIAVVKPGGFSQLLEAGLSQASEKP